MSASTATKRCRPRLLRLEGRELCTFTPVAATTALPYSAVVHVTAWYDVNHDGRLDAGDALAQASGVLIGPRTALTSAHVVYDAALGGLATGVTITPGENGNRHPYGTEAVASWVVPQLYTTPGTSLPRLTGADVAVLNLPANGPALGDETGWLTPRAYTPLALRGVTVGNVGYPAITFTGRSQYQSSGPILGAQEVDGEGILRFSDQAISIQPGSSGSPLFLRTPEGTTAVVGLVEAKLLGTGMDLATQITGSVSRFIAAARQVQGPGGRVLPFAFEPSEPPRGA